MAESIWRDDEGPDVGSTAPAKPTQAPTNASEGEHAAASIAPTQPPPVWRDDEGVAWVEVPRALPPKEEPPVDIDRPQRRWRRAAAASRPYPWLAYASGTLVVLALLLTADALYSGVTMADALPRVADRLQDVRAALREGDPATAHENATAARDDARTAIEVARHPGVAVAGFLPFIGSDARALVGLSEAAESGSLAAAKAAEVAAQVGLDSTGLGNSLYSDGRVDIDAIATVRPLVGEATAHLVDAVDSLDDLAHPNVGSIRDALETTRRLVGDALASARRGGIMMSALPSVLGAQEERRYLLAFQASGEARATGGVAGLYGVLVADDGTLRLAKVAPYGELFPRFARPVEVDDWFEDSYAPQAATTQWPQANVSPNFPVVAEVMMAMYRRAAGRSVDGVVAMDPLALQGLLEATGPVRVEDQDVTAQDVARLLLHDSYLQFPDPAAQNAFVAAVVRSFWERVRTGTLDIETMSAALQTAGRTQHVKFYSRDEGARDMFAEFDLDGDYSRYGPNVQMVFNNNYSVNKVDYFLRRSIETEVDLNPGSTEVRTTVTMTNTAPNEPASLLLGSGLEDPIGLNRMMLNLLMPDKAEVDAVRIGDRTTAGFQYLDDSNPVVWDLIEIPAGETVSISFSYSMEVPPTGEFTFTLFPQATAIPDRFSLSLGSAPGLKITSAEGAALADGTARVSGTLDRPRSVRLTVARS